VPVGRVALQKPAGGVGRTKLSFGKVEDVLAAGIRTHRESAVESKAEWPRAVQLSRKPFGDLGVEDIVVCGVGAPVTGQTSRSKLDHV